jgi:hypothetical protein
MTRPPATKTNALDRITRIMPELALDDVDRHAFTGKLHGVGVSELVRRETSSHPSGRRQMPQFVTGGGG